MVSRRLVAIVAAAGLPPPALAACGSDDDPPSSAWVGSTPPAGAATPSEVAQEESTATGTAAGLAVEITPASGKTGVPVSAEIGVQVAGGEVKSVTLTATGGDAVRGELREDGSAWV